MKYFVQLKDDVVFAYHESSTEVDIPGDNIIEVDQEGINYLKKKYINGSFVDAPIIKYAKLDSNNTVISIDETVFTSDIPANAKIVDDTVKVLDKWNGTDFNTNKEIEPISTITVGDTEVTTSNLIPALTEDEIHFINAQIDEMKAQQSNNTDTPQ